MTNFDSMRREVISNSVAFGGASGNEVSRNYEKSSNLIAASVLVIKERGQEWCSANPAAFEESVLSKLSTWVKLGLWIASMFAGGGGIWLTLASWILPTVISWFEAQQVAGSFGEVELDGLADGALKYLKESKK